MSSSSPPSLVSSSSAESLFVAWLEESRRRDAADLETVCAAHPGDAAELRALWAHWQSLERVLAHLEARGAPSLAQKIEARFGAGIDPKVELEAPAQAPASSALLARLSERSSKDSRYRLQGEIARGGMGAILKIWDEDMRRSLAMKVILGRDKVPSSGDSPAVEPQLLTRFLEEAQVTGQLDHPGIVPVHELGLDEQGRVYFTMKLVKGRDLREVYELVFEEKEGWSETKALGVILKVCEALSYAHAKGVIHRDLKPANVMVGGFGEVYVMDWGLARVLGREDAHDLRIARPALTTTALRTERADAREQTPDSPLVTMDGIVLGTPAYMSPEQARSEIEKLGARSDVYAVGAMLYHLLGRRAPFHVPGARVSPHTILARLIDGPPTPLAELRSGLPEELVAIVEKAMAREPEGRYRDTAELAADLSAYLEHRVVSAYETGTWAETKKWVRRNQPLAASIAASLLVLAAGLAGTWTQARRADAKAAEALSNLEEARRQTALAEANARVAQDQKRAAEAATQLARQSEEEAQKRAEETREVAEFQTRMLADLSIDEFGHVLVTELRKEAEAGLRRMKRSDGEIASALEAFDRAMTPANPTNVARLALSRVLFEPAVKVIEDQYSAQPLIQAVLQTSLAETLLVLRLDSLGARVIRPAVESRRKSLGDRHPDTLTSINNLALLLRHQGKLDEAEPLCREALGGFRTMLGDEHPNTLTSLNNLALLMQARGKLDDAEALCREALGTCRAKLGTEHRSTLASVSNLALVLQSQGKLVEAEPLYREAQEMRRAELGNDHPETLVSINNLASLLQARGKIAEAEPLCREALEGRRAKLGDEHPDTLLSIHTLATLIRAQGKLEEAEALHHQSLTGFRAKLGDGHPVTLASMSAFASLLQARGKLAEAEPLCREALDGRRAHLENLHPETLLSIHNLASLLQARGKLAEAEPLYREALAGSRTILGNQHPTTLASVNNLASLLRAQGRFADSEQLCREALDGYRASLGGDHPDTLASISNLAFLLRAQGRLAEAEALWCELLETCRTKLGDEHLSTLSTLHNLASLLQAQGRFAEAEPLHREAFTGRRAKLGFQNAQTQRTLDALLALYAAMHERDPTAGFDRKAAELRSGFGR